MTKSRQELLAAALDMKIARKREVGRNGKVFSRIYVYKLKGVEAVPLDRVNFKSLKMQNEIRQCVLKLCIKGKYRVELRYESCQYLSIFDKFHYHGSLQITWNKRDGDEAKWWEEALLWLKEKGKE